MLFKNSFTSELSKIILTYLSWGTKICELSEWISHEMLLFCDEAAKTCKTCVGLSVEIQPQMNCACRQYESVHINNFNQPKKVQKRPVQFADTGANSLKKSERY